MVWNPFAPKKRRVRVEVQPGPNETLHFTFTGLPPGMGFPAALADLSREDFDDDTAWKRARTLGDLLLDLIGAPAGDGLAVPISEYYSLEEEQRADLKLASDNHLFIRLRSKGNLSEPTFALQWSFTQADGREAMTWERKGCFLMNELERALLSADEYTLLLQLEAFASRPVESCTYEAQLTSFVALRALAVKVGAKLDAYIEAEGAHRPEHIRPGVRRGTDGHLVIEPEVAGIDSARLGAALDTYGRVPGILTVQGANGSRDRLVLPPDVRSALGQVGRVRRMPPEVRERLLVRPQDYLDPDLFDLDDFSERVTGIGRFTPRYWPFAVPGERPWLPPTEVGLTLDASDIESPPERLPFSSMAEIDAFEAAYRSAQERGEPVFEYDARHFPITGDTEPMIATLREMMERKEGQAPKPGRWMLIIEENLEESRYSEGEGTIVPTEVRLTRPAALLPDVQILKHQAEGIGFLQHVFASSWRGVLLADDMGLGKTLQILTFLAWHHETAGVPGRPILIVAPVALLDNWVAEYRKFMEPLWRDPLLLHGAGLRRFKAGGGGVEETEPAVRPERLLDHAAIAQHPLVLTTYEAVRDYQFSLCAIDWSVVVVDEAQKIKTPSSLMTTAIKALKADFRVVATGTPVENSLVDLWCLTDFAQPGLLGALRTFRARYADQGEPRSDATERLRKAIAPVFIRRLKRDVLPFLPPRTEQSPRIPMAPVQVQRYLEVAQAARGAAAAPTAVLGALHRLRDVMVHPDLIDDEDPRIDLKRLPQVAPKLQWVVNQLERIQQAREKCVIFAEKRNAQRLLAELVRARFSFMPSIVNGEVKGSGAGLTRLDLIRTFEEVVGFNVIILSPLAVGYGLTITAANHVIHATRLWNPAKEDQATDRVHRIGQRREVFVNYPTMVAPDGRFETFDEILAKLLAGKRTLASGVLQPSARMEVQMAELTRAFEVNG
jgi:hypothetical protein